MSEAQKLGNSLYFNTITDGFEKKSKSNLKDSGIMYKSTSRIRDRSIGDNNSFTQDFNKSFEAAKQNKMRSVTFLTTANDSSKTNENPNAYFLNNNFQVKPEKVKYPSSKLIVTIRNSSNSSIGLEQTLEELKSKSKIIKINQENRTQAQFFDKSINDKPEQSQQLVKFIKFIKQQTNNNPIEAKKIQNQTTGKLQREKSFTPISLGMYQEDQPDGNYLNSELFNPIRLSSMLSFDEQDQMVVQNLENNPARMKHVQVAQLVKYRNDQRSKIKGQLIKQKFALSLKQGSNKYYSNNYLESDQKLHASIRKSPPKNTKQNEQVISNRESDNNAKKSEQKQISFYNDHNIFGHFKNTIEDFQLQINASFNYWKRGLMLVQFPEFQMKEYQKKNKISLDDDSLITSNQINSLKIYQQLIGQALTILFTGFRNFRNSVYLEETIQSVIRESHIAKDFLLCSILYYANAQILIARQNYSSAISYLKKAKQASDSQYLMPTKMKCYKQLGKCFQILKLYKLSLFYFYQYLDCAWFLDDLDAQIDCYEKIGIQYFYLNDLNKADTFHTRMQSGHFEPLDSEIRRITKKKIHLSMSQGKSYLEQMEKKKQIIQKKMQAAEQTQENLEFDFIISSSDDDEVGIHSQLVTNDRNISEQRINHIKSLFSRSAKFIDQQKKHIYTQDEQDKDDMLDQQQSSNHSKFEKGNFIKRIYEYTALNSNIIQLKGIQDYDVRKEHNKKANENIRSSSGETDTSHKTKSKFYFGSDRDRSISSQRLSHLSINRGYQNFQVSDVRVNLTNKYESLDLLEKGSSKISLKSIKIFVKTVDNLIFAITNIDMCLLKLQSHIDRDKKEFQNNRTRRGGIRVSKSYFQQELYNS